ncbi:MAG: type I-C CRISPR-associated protein Cas8c/Csd1 [Methylocystis sp.]
MSALASLVRAYERMEDAPPFGYSAEKIGFLISLREDGTVANVTDLREGEGKKKTTRLMPVPASFKRPGITPKAFFLWDNSAYVLGVSGSDGKDGAARLAAFRERHQRDLSTTDDPGLKALLAFLNWWTPEDFDRFGWPTEMKDQNIVFALESDRLARIHIHDRPAARALWARICDAGDRPASACLITGERAPVARLHPAIKGVWGAQSSGASLVSFNLDAFNSYGHEQGDNAPVSEAAAFAYTTALNRFLERDSGHRLQIGDASTVYWADASSAHAPEVEGLFAALLGEVDETAEARKIAAILDAVRQGRPIDTLTPDLPPDVRFFVLGLSPNAARLSVRFYIEDDFGEIAKRYLQHIERMRIEPPPREAALSMRRMLIETASQRKSENIPPLLAGEWLRAILTGAPYPLSLLATVLMRLRVDHDVNARRVAMLKAVLIRNFRMEAPVALDPENDDPGYLLGRLFATYEYAQTQALGGNVNATIRDQYYGTASATPRSVFPLLQRKATHHLSKLRKEKPGLAVKLDRKIGEICEHANADSLFPPTLNPRRQALFAIGYYHQRNDFFRAREDAQKIEE